MLINKQMVIIKLSNQLIENKKGHKGRNKEEGL